MNKKLEPLIVKKGKTFLAKYLGPTNSRGSRVKVVSLCQPERQKSFTLAWNYEKGEGTYLLALEAFLEKHGQWFFDLREGETYEVLKAYSPLGCYFTVRVAR